MHPLDRYHIGPNFTVFGGGDASLAMQRWAFKLYFHKTFSLCFDQSPYKNFSS